MKRLAACLLPLALLAAAPPAALAQEPDRALVKRAVVKAPLEAAWKAWTTAEGIRTFFAPEAVVDARPGGAFDIHFNPYAKPGLKGADGMVVLAVQEKKLLSFTWNAPPHLPEARAQRTSVAVRFKPLADNETEVRLVHTGWGEGGQWDQAFDYFDKAWARVMANLEKRFVDGPVDWAPFLKGVKAFQDAEDAKAAGAKKP